MRKHIKTKGKQAGMASLVALIIAMGATLLFVMEFTSTLTKNNIKANSQSFYNRLLFLNTQFHAFANDRYLAGQGINTPHIFPFELQQLEGDYLPICSDADNKEGYCFKYNQTPWGEIAKDDYQVLPVGNPGAPSHYRAELTLKLPDKDNEALKYDRQATLSMLAKMPNLFYDEPNSTLIMRIERPDKAFAYESLIKRSGDDSTLLGDWDVGGNHAITNAKDYTIRNSDGSQQLVSTGLVKILQVNHRDFIDKPRCPVDQEPNVTLSINTVTVTNEFTLKGSIKPFILSETDRQWQVGLEIRVVINATGQPHSIEDGVITAFVQCT
ncbi:type II secretion system protein [Aliivibrio salmonicida]|uniref:type II secretion system protein n=1 Tax=Aliivibrio salmonicida TaxID=40269 RepID=UPI00406BF6B1